ncbi:MAG TPA: hypothetical protein PL123_14370 [Bacteroidales bacterium]|nr:hypothetical protein [Bacteroidales bacterium]
MESNENKGSFQGNNAGTDINDKLEKARQEGERKGVKRAYRTSFLPLLIFAVIVIFLYMRDHKKQLNQMESQKTTLTGEISVRDSLINEWISTFDEIEKNIALIKEKQNFITINSKGNELPEDRRIKILEDIQTINTLLEQNKKKIASLTRQLAKSGVTIKALNQKVADLELEIKKSENLVSDLKNELVDKDFEIEQLNVQVDIMQETIEQKDEVIVSQINELNKAYYACGTFRELKAKGLLTKEGGFIGLGRTKTIAENFSDTVFIQIDITKTKSIPVNSKEAKLISEHPGTSYSFIREGDLIDHIEIKDPAEFWRISKYAVVELGK